MAQWQDPQMPTMAFPPFVGVTKKLILINAAIFVVTFLLYVFATDAAYAWVHEHLTLDPEVWRASFPWMPVWQVLTYGFLHAVRDFWHVGFNMLSLYFFGTMLEESIGGRRFLLCYLSAQLAGAALYLIAGAAGVPSGPAVGASGAVFGVMMAVATMHPHRRILFLFVPLTLRTLMLLFVVMTIFQSLLTLKGGSDGTAHLIHLGGLAYGYLAVKSGFLFVDPVEKVRVRRAVADVERRQSDDARVDQLLDKIHREGMGALTPSERDFLRRVSSRK